MSKDELDQRIRELEESVPLWERLSEPDDVERSILQRLALRLWRAGLPQILFGVALSAIAVGVLPWTGYDLVSAPDARLARTLRAHLPDADRLPAKDLLVRAAIGERALGLVVDVVSDPVPADPLSWTGRLSFQTPPLVRADRAAALKDLARLLGDLPRNERLARLDWLVTLAAETTNPHSGLAHGLEALSRLPVELRRQLLAGDVATLKSLIRLLQERNAAALTLESLDKALAAEKGNLDRELARRRDALDAVKARHAEVSGIGAACSATWRRFEACTSVVLAPGKAPRDATPGR